ncbi:MAG: hypothetical protein QME63_10140 [Actinomycetota bacterium]|nr:hypothetical protein [Actinomycetota bacterium]
MARKMHLPERFVQYASGMATELLFSIFLAVIAFIISALVLRWF